jgi:hypothetical protein
MSVGRVEVEVVEGVVAVIERGAGEGGGKQRAAEQKKKEQPEKVGCRDEVMGLGLRQRRRCR